MVKIILLWNCTQRFIRYVVGEGKKGSCGLNYFVEELMVVA